MSEEQIFGLLEEYFGQENVIREWDVSKESRDALRRNLQYCPRIDFAVKPLNTDRHRFRNSYLINRQYQHHLELVHSLIQRGLSSPEFSINSNPRCFMAIEYENKTGTKHRLGSLVNASAIGLIGIIITSNQKTYDSYKRIVEYLKFIQNNKKLNARIANFIVLKKEVFEQTLREYLDR